MALSIVKNKRYESSINAVRFKTPKNTRLWQRCENVNPMDYNCVDVAMMKPHPSLHVGVRIIGSIHDTEVTFWNEILTIKIK